MSDLLERIETFWLECSDKDVSDEELLRKERALYFEADLERDKLLNRISELQRSIKKLESINGRLNSRISRSKKTFAADQSIEDFDPTRKKKIKPSPENESGSNNLMSLEAIRNDEDELTNLLEVYL